MQSILVLTDFSDNAFLAAEYAAMLSKVWKSKRIVLFHAYHTTGPIANTPMVASGREDLHNESLQILEVWEESLRQLTDIQTTIDILVDDTHLETGINRICEDEKIDLIVMGITGKTALEKVVIGSNAIRIMENTDYPLLIVPNEVTIRYPQTILLTTDLKEVEDKMQMPELDDLLTGLSAKILVLNVANKEGELPELRKEIGALHTLLDKFSPEYHYINHQNIVEGINTFANDKGIDVIIALHHQQTGFASLFRKSVTKKLAWHAQTPLIVLPVSS